MSLVISFIRITLCDCDYFCIRFATIISTSLRKDCSKSAIIFFPSFILNLDKIKTTLLLSYVEVTCLTKAFPLHHDPENPLKYDSFFCKHNITPCLNMIMYYIKLMVKKEERSVISFATQIVPSPILLSNACWVSETKLSKTKPSLK